MRPRGILLVVLGLLVLGGFVHAPLHAHEEDHDDCPLVLFCSGAAVALAFGALVLAGMAPAGAIRTARPIAVRSHARGAAGARGPPRS